MFPRLLVPSLHFANSFSRRGDDETVAHFLRQASADALYCQDAWKQLLDVRGPCFGFRVAQCRLSRVKSDMRCRLDVRGAIADSLFLFVGGTVALRFGPSWGKRPVQPLKRIFAREVQGPEAPPLETSGR